MLLDASGRKDCNSRLRWRLNDWPLTYRTRIVSPFLCCRHAIRPPSDIVPLPSLSGVCTCPTNRPISQPANLLVVFTHVLRPKKRCNHIESEGRRAQQEDKKMNKCLTGRTRVFHCVLHNTHSMENRTPKLIDTGCISSCKVSLNLSIPCSSYC